MPHELIVPAAEVIVNYVHGFALSEGLALREDATGGSSGLAGLLERHASLSLPAMRRAMRASPTTPAPVVGTVEPAAVRPTQLLTGRFIPCRSRPNARTRISWTTAPLASA